MRIRLEKNNDEPRVPLSPLIDCVFLLLIFFLVTTQLKRWEMQIPLRLPSSTSSLSAEAKEPTYSLAMDAQGRAYEIVQRDIYSGKTERLPIAKPTAFLRKLAQKHGPELPLEIAADEAAPMKDVIALFDLCQFQGFTRTRVRMSSFYTRPQERSR